MNRDQEIERMLDHLFDACVGRLEKIIDRHITEFRRDLNADLRREVRNLRKSLKTE